MIILRPAATLIMWLANRGDLTLEEARNLDHKLPFGEYMERVAEPIANYVAAHASPSIIIPSDLDEPVNSAAIGLPSVTELSEEQREQIQRLTDFLDNWRMITPVEWRRAVARQSDRAEIANGLAPPSVRREEIRGAWITAEESQAAVDPVYGVDFQGGLRHNPETCGVCQAEGQGAWYERLYAIGRRTALEMQQEKQDIYNKARASLLEELDDLQRKHFEERGYFHVRGGTSGQLYRIVDEPQYNVWVVGDYDTESKDSLIAMCANTKDIEYNFPVFDLMAWQKTWLEYNEIEFIELANLVSPLGRDQIRELYPQLKKINLRIGFNPYATFLD